MQPRKLFPEEFDGRSCAKFARVHLFQSFFFNKFAFCKPATLFKIAFLVKFSRKIFIKCLSAAPSMCFNKVSGFRNKETQGITITETFFIKLNDFY